MRPGIDQLPGTNMEYYIADEGLVYRTKDQTILVNTFDTPLLYMGEIVEQGTAEKDMESLSDNDKGVVTFICG